MGWLTGYKYRKLIVIEGAQGAGNNFQVTVNVYSGVGINTIGIAYLNDKAINFPIDIRFTESNGVTELSYFRKDCNTYLIKITESLETNRNIYIYFSNNTATDASNILNTSTLATIADDFGNGAWTSYAGNYAEHMVIKNNKIYGAADGLVIIDALSGTLLKNWLVGTGYGTAPIIDNNGFIHIYTSVTGLLKKINEDTGEILSVIVGTLPMDFETLCYDEINDRIIIPYKNAGEDGIIAYNCSDYSIAWKNIDPATAESTTGTGGFPIIIGNYIIYRSNANGVLWKLNLNDGTTDKSQALTGNGQGYGYPIYDELNGYIYVPSNAENTIYCRLFSDLTEVWTKVFEAGYSIIRTQCYHAKKLIVSSRENAVTYRAKLYCLNTTSNGDIIWTNTTPFDNGADAATPIMDDDYAYIGTYDYIDGNYKKLLVLNLADGTLAKSYTLDGNISCCCPLPLAGKILCGMWDTFNYQSIPVRATGTYDDSEYKINKYRTGYVGTRLSGILQDEVITINDTKWANTETFTVLAGSARKGIGSSAILKSLATISYPVIIEAKAAVDKTCIPPNYSGWLFALGWDSAWATSGYLGGHFVYASPVLRYDAVIKYPVGTQDITNIIETSGPWHIISLRILNDTQKIYTDNILKGTITTELPQTETNVYLASSKAAPATAITLFDWILVRKYLQVEPIVGIPGKTEIDTTIKKKRINRMLVM